MRGSKAAFLEVSAWSGVSQAISLRLGPRRLQFKHRLDQSERVDRSSGRDVYTSVDDLLTPVQGRRVAGYFKDKQQAHFGAVA